MLGLTKQVNEALEREGLKVPIRVAVMGCVVNGPGEAREADLGIAAGKGQGFLDREGRGDRQDPRGPFRGTGHRGGPQDRGRTRSGGRDVTSDTSPRLWRIVFPVNNLMLSLPS